MRSIRGEFSTMLRFRFGLTLRLALAVAFLLADGLVGQRGASAHQDPNPSPNGRSPWNVAESWYLTQAYGVNRHKDYYDGMHLNAHYSLDFDGDCGKRVYPIYNGMRVTTIKKSASISPRPDEIQMQATINGVSYKLTYLHLSRINVSVGQSVGTDTVVGLVGDLGHTNGCHLHMQVHRLHSGGQWYSIPPKFCGRTYTTGAWYRGC